MNILLVGGIHYQQVELEWAPVIANKISSSHCLSNTNINVLSRTGDVQFAQDVSFIFQETFNFPLSCVFKVQSSGRFVNFQPVLLNIKNSEQK